MRALSFFSKFAFICNLLFLVCLIIQRTHDFIGSQSVNYFVIPLGWFVSPLINLIVCLWYGARWAGKRPVNTPRWLVLVNFLFLLMQLFIHFILPS
jgi:hypothetical protein